MVSFDSLAVFPCCGIADGQCSCGRADCRSPGKHPLTRNGCLDASSNPAVLARWRKRWPSANLAIATGSISGVVVIDVDPKGGGWGSLMDLQEIHPGLLPATWEVETGGGGLHKYYRLPEGVVIGSRNRWKSGIDIKGDGGYVIAPGSLHVSGRLYQWKHGRSPSDIELAELPESLVPSMPISGGSIAKPRSTRRDPQQQLMTVGLRLSLPASWYERHPAS